MQCPWGWAWQRPHIAATELARGFKVDVYLPTDRGDQMVGNPVPESLTLLPYRDEVLFFRDRFPEVISNYEIAWFCWPGGFSQAYGKVPENVRVVYDYMDDALSFSHIAARPLANARIWLDEIALVERSDLVFASSQTLARRLADRYRLSSHPTVVNNAAPTMEDRPPVSVQTSRGGLRMVYVGTVASWFDFPTVLQALDAVPDAVCHLVGPLHVTPPSHPRLKILGPKLHAKALELMLQADVLIMPFVIDRLTEGVDPVKLYEYIQARIPVVAVAYGESRRFAEYVYLYDSAPEFTAVVKSAATTGLQSKGSSDAVASFLHENSWEKRGIAWRGGVSELCSRTITRPDLPHLAHQREQLTNIVTHMEKLAGRLAKRTGVV